ncbi:hypothetical protein A6F68_02075 [Tsuneonella dongtanensis]|uniref:Secreted protein n=1 Tax=Tsuneonella dongtanensis TaxID=692370 RepID=A0A1B2AEK1_9SPHN|nr:hypothetical protein [Tsuneonella dongtanensis]ANY20579.1 hypothetical protein A6F68_02075 [Tsuneonella dongtanensis]
MRTAAALSIAVSVAGTGAMAYDPIVIARGWERVDAFDDGACSGEIGTNGRFYVISAAGFEPGERTFLTITNGDMRPIERPVRADGRGEWHDYYIPFRYNRGEGGDVTVTVSGESCVVPLGFTWSRAKGWEVPPPLVPR